ncbi:unnamed protein product [Amoebophrya sp. A120]|nr:unnamed protein product [Amoebophrya sp. A120]|eukprot:GSA120T00008042001.1
MGLFLNIKQERTKNNREESSINVNVVEIAPVLKLRFMMLMLVLDKPPC